MENIVKLIITFQLLHTTISPCFVTFTILCMFHITVILYHVVDGVCSVSVCYRPDLLVTSELAITISIKNILDKKLNNFRSYLQINHKMWDRLLSNQSKLNCGVSQSSIRINSFFLCKSMD